MFQKILIIISLIVGIGVIWFALSLNAASTPGSVQPTNAVREEQGKQIIHVLARGGYSPEQIVAKADMPTVLEIETKGTYDCSAALNIPKLKFKKFLPGTGTTKVDVPAELARETIDGICAMGMYSFQVRFES
jgi:plastocyanin domain-containing protein